MHVLDAYWLYSCFCVLAKLLSISLVSCMLMYDYAYIPISLCVCACVSRKGGLYVSAGRTLKPVMHTCAGLYGAAVDLFVESLPLLSSFLLLSFGKWPCHPLLQRTLIYTCLNSTGEREKQNERGTEEKT